jgi:hypothetical protein
VGVAGLLAGSIVIFLQRKNNKFHNMLVALIPSLFWIGIFLPTDIWLKFRDIQGFLTLIGVSYISGRMLIFPIDPLIKNGWSWQNAKKGATLGMILGLIIGMISGLVLISSEISTIWDLADQPSNFINTQSVFTIFLWLTTGLVYALVAQPIFALVGGVVIGYRAKTITTTNYPNQGIWRSLRASLILVITLGCLTVALAVIFNLAKIEIPSWMRWEFPYAFAIALMFLELIAIPIKHFILRVLLFATGKIPWNYAKLLNYTTNCILLQRIGGGYVFAHRLLLEHFEQIYNNQEV